MFEKYLTKTGRLSTKQPQEVKNQWYIQKFQEVHGDRYNYSKVVYINSTTKVEILCKEHGEFLQTPNSHLSGNGCSICQGSKKKDTKKCIEDLRKIHGDTYDYSKVEYKTSKEKVEIVCKEHGSFFQTPNHHLRGKGCPDCQGTKKKNTNKCIEDFRKIHGDTYDYCKVQYINKRTKVEIICKEHGGFLQTPDSHLRGKGCPKCQNHNQDTLYILKCLDTGLIKIGITNNLKQRISSIGGNLEYLHHVIVDNPREHEKILHSTYKPYNVFNPNVRNGGTEFFQLSQGQVQEVIYYLESVQQGEF